MMSAFICVFVVAHDALAIASAHAMQQGEVWLGFFHAHAVSNLTGMKGNGFLSVWEQE